MFLIKCDKDGNVIAGVPEDGNDHCLDAVRYGMSSIIPIVRQREMAVNIPSFVTQSNKSRRGR